MGEASVIALRRIELGGADIDRSAKFYGDIWGFDELAMNDNDATRVSIKLA